MLDSSSRRAVDDHEVPAWHDDGTSCEPYNPSGVYEPRGDALPDLDDPATLGAVEHGLLAPAGVWVERIRDASGAPLWCAYNDGGPVSDEWHYSLAAALVDALERTL